MNNALKSFPAQAFQYTNIVNSPLDMAHTHGVSKSIYERICEIRAEHGKENTQVAIAKDLGIHQTSVHKWAKGHGDPKPGHVYEIAEMEGVCVEWLFTGRGQKYPAAEDISSLVRKIESLPEDRRQEILRFVDFQATRSSHN